MNFLSLIEAKRDGLKLTADELRQFIAVLAELPDYQVASFLMAVFFRGLDTEETAALTLGMRDSGDVLRFPKDSRPLVDKHSTGGVGDKVSLPLAPLLACLGFRVPMISGRGLGITGGTLDKLESIPGFNTALSAERIVELVQQVGCVICGQTERMVPADKRLYALRDVTGTVPSIPLITASILSKKLAERLDALVLDVKFGSAAFMQTRDQARALAQAMVALGNQCGTNTRALLTDMSTPLGRAAGNWLEVKESVACLDGKGPDDLRQLVVEFAASLLVQTGRETDIAVAREHASTCLSSGAPRRKWDE
ncbi:MAG: Pyrimidine-nucleoside phosphorylase, partial [Verrucomicrobiota bacterium]